MCSRALEPLVPTVSTEAVLAANPEAIVTAAQGATRAGHDVAATRQHGARGRVSTAVANHNLFAIDGDLINRPAPRIAQGAQQLCEDLELARSHRKPAQSGS